jgi:hypothetical protein
MPLPMKFRSSFRRSLRGPPLPPVVVGTSFPAQLPISSEPIHTLMAGIRVPFLISTRLGTVTIDECAPTLTSILVVPR